MFLHVEDLHKAFGAEPVLSGVQCTLAVRQTLSILGRSGGGKTTLLKIIAGLETPDGGTIRLDGRDITGLPPQQRGVVYLYQEPLLFPHLNVRENVAFGLRLRHVAAAQRRRRVTEMLEQLGVADHADKMPHQLSGGQRQRVAFGRAIIVNPALLLLDEPFGNLDVEIRASMQDLFKQVAADYGITTLFVTHDLKEAVLMGDRIAHLRGGRLKMYPSKQAFIADPEVGVQQEIAFWRALDRPEPEG